MNCDFNDTVQFILKNPVCFLNILEFKAMGNEWCGIDLTLRNQLQRFCTVAAVYAASFEGKIFLLQEDAEDEEILDVFQGRSSFCKEKDSFKTV